MCDKTLLWKKYILTFQMASACSLTMNQSDPQASLVLVAAWPCA